MKNLWEWKRITLTHVGNDIVDLESPFANGKSKDKRFINRVLTTKEQEIVQGKQFDDYLLWSHWAAKESAFKVVSKIKPDVSSSPKKYEVYFDKVKQFSIQKGVVYTPVKKIHVCVHRNMIYGNKWIHCVGSSRQIDLETAIFYREEQIDHLFDYNFAHASKKESSYVRKIAGKKISQILSESSENIEFKKNVQPGKHSYPEVFIKNRKTNIDISFSHDGKFVAYAFCLNQNKKD